MSSEFDLNLKKPASIPRALYWDIRSLSPKRLSSIGYQLKLAVESKSSNFLEIGIGNGLLSELLRTQSLDVISFDLNYNLAPQVVGNLSELPFVNNGFEVVLCFEALEHLPFTMLQQNLREMRRIAKKYLIISVPDQSHMGRFEHIVGMFQTMAGRKKALLPTEHYWELGYQNISAKNVVFLARKEGLYLIKDFRNPFHIYHHFFMFGRGND